MTQQPPAEATAAWAAPQPGTAHEPPTHAHEPTRRRGAGAWIGLVVLATLACLLAWTLSPLAARLLQLDSDLDLRGLVFGVTPTSYALGTGPFLNILLLGVAAAALVTRRVLAALTAVTLALLLGCVGHVLSALLAWGTVRPLPVLLGLLLSALVVLPATAVAALLARSPWGRLIVVAVVLAPTLLVVLQQVVFVLGGMYSRVPSLVVLGLVVALVAGVAAGGGRGGAGESAARLLVGLVLLLVGGALLPLLSSGLLAVVSEVLPRDLGGGMPTPRVPGLDQLLTPFQAMRVTWPAWIGGIVVGALVGGGVLAARRGARRSRALPAA